MTLTEAENVLEAVPEYHWLIANPKPWWGTVEVAEGLGIGKKKVLDWCEQRRINGSINYGGTLGRRMPRSGLLLYLAQRHLAGGDLPDSNSTMA